MSDENKVTNPKIKLFEDLSFWFWFIICFAFGFYVFVGIPLMIGNTAGHKLEYYVAQEIDKDIPESLPNCDEITFELKEIKEQRDDLLDKGAEWKIYNVKFYCLSEEEESVVTKEYIAFVYYKYVKGHLFRNGYYAILDCDLAIIN